MLPASSSGRIALVLVGTLLSVVLMRWLLPLLARSQIGGSRLIFSEFASLVLVGGRRCCLP